MKTEITIGAEIDKVDASKLCEKLDMACEIRSGKFTYRIEGGCTHFTAPRQLGVVPFRIAKAMVDGYRLGVFG